MSRINRRFLLRGLALMASASLMPAVARAKPRVLVHKDPSCGCCGAWVEHIAKAGFPTEVAETSRINVEKARLGIPESVWSCHTAEIDGYVLEGHVPVPALERLLAERPAIRGLAVPGMPVGSPGMEVADMTAETYEVMAFGEGDPTVYMRFVGSDPSGSR